MALPPSRAHSHPPSNIETLIKQRAYSLGFDLVGITSAEPSAFAAEYRNWIANGYAGKMEYLARNPERRTDPRMLLPNARSIIVVGMNYYVREEGRGKREEGESGGEHVPLPSWERLGEGESGRQGVLPTVDETLRPTTYDLRPGEAVFARYARGDDYHDVMEVRLRKLLDYLKAEAGPDADGRVYVDTGPILEREAAQRAGLGWFGKNTMLINTRRGSYFFLGEIVTNVPLNLDEPAVGGCGTCTRCLDACPTNAFVAPFVLDSRRCISYLTIELKDQIPEELVPVIGAAGNRVYGCDICQEVCPINRTHLASRHPTLYPTEEPAFQPRDVTTNSKVTDLLYMTDEDFREKFKGSPVKRAKRRGLLRNATAALSSRDDAEAIAALEHALNDPEQLVSDAAAAALEQIRARHAAKTTIHSPDNNG